MGNAVLLTGDRIFGRMLELELTAAGHTVVFDRGNGREDADARSGAHTRAHSRAKSHSPAAAFDTAEADVYLLDLDTRSEDSILALLRPAQDALPRDRLIVFSRNRAPAFEAARVLIRPFESAGLLNAIAEVMRAHPQTAEAGPALTLDHEARRAFFGGEPLGLTRREFDLLECLDENRGSPVSRDELIRRVWHYDFAGSTNVVDVYIRYLREKLDERFHQKFIETVRGRGYRLRR